MDLNKKKRLFIGIVEFILTVLRIIIIQFQKNEFKTCYIISFITSI